MTMKLGVQEEPAIYKVLLGLANTVPLAHVTEFNPRRHSVPPADADLVSFVPMRAVTEESGHIDSEACRPWSEVKKGYTAFQNGDVIFAKITPCMENGKFALASALHGGRAAGSTEFHVFRAKPGLLPKYLFHFLFTPYVRRGAKMNMKGAAGQLRVPIQFFEGLRIPLPAPEEQKRVVDYLDEQLSRLDASVAALHRVKANLKRYRASVLKSACEGRLVPTEAELARREGRNFETGTQLLHRVACERERFGTSHIRTTEDVKPELTGLDEPPAGWTWASGGQALNHIEAGKSFKCEERPPLAGEVGVLKVSSVSWGEFDEEESKTCVDEEKIDARYMVKAGDLLFSRANTIELVGACVIVNVVHRTLMLSDKTLRFSVSSAILPQWLLYCLRSQLGRADIERLSTGNQESMRNIGQARIRQIRVPLPPLAEQHRIVAEADRRLSLIRVAEAQVAANLARAQRLRQSILQAAFSGPGSTSSKM